MKAVSVSAELTVIQRAIDGAATLIELDRQGGIEGEDNRANVAAILALASCRLRDLGRASRSSLDVETFWAPHNAAVDENDDEDLVLYPEVPRTRDADEQLGPADRPGSSRGLFGTWATLERTTSSRRRQCRPPKEGPRGDAERIGELNEDGDREIRLSALDALEETEVQLREFRELLLREPAPLATASHVRTDVVEDLPGPSARHPSVGTLDRRHL